MRKIDLTGEQFGEWTVIRYAGDRKWLCRCSCGTEREVCGSYLRGGVSNSCGHANNSFKDLTGKHFGYWEALEYIGNRKWLCKCTACGNNKEVSTCNLLNGTTRSCGCINERSIDLTGKQFGELRVIRKLEKGLWECQCSCGKIVNVYGSNLRKESGGTRSCGCKFYEHGAQTRIKNGTTGFRNDEQIQIIKSRDSFIKYLMSFECPPTVKQLSDKLNLGDSEILLKIHEYGAECFVELNNAVSYDESKLSEFIGQLTNCEIIHNNRKVLNGKELDIYIPDKKLAIEFNGSYWHSDEFKDKKYHQLKTRQCAYKNIRTIHIFSYEWNNIDKRNKIKAYLSEIISDKNQINIIYGRNTIVKEISNKDAIEFCNKYHLQNGINSEVNLGIYNKNEIVGVMTFGRPRFNSNYQWEINRLCFKNNVRVIGGAEKLFKHFLRAYNPDSIITYCDFSKFVGNTYLKLGMQLDELTDPNYVWVDKDDSYLTRYQTQKHKLIELGLADITDTEDSKMRELGYKKVYDCGNLKFTWNRTEI